MRSPALHFNRVTKMPAQWRLVVLQSLARWGVREETLLMGLAFLTGIAAGGAVRVFEITLHAISYYYFFVLTQKFHATSSCLFLLPLFPAAGGLAVVGVRKLFRSPHSRLHGVAAVLYALIKKAASLKTSMGLETLFTSSLTIGTGGSGGPEAPIAVIGSSLGSIIGRIAGISRRNLPTLIGCGAAAGISAVFQAPIAGVLFSLEVMLKDFSVRSFIPIVLSAVLATVTYQTITGEVGGGLFAMPPSGIAYQFTFHEIPYYLLLGVICGFMAVLFTKILVAGETASHRLGRRVPHGFHPAIGAGLSGVCGVVLLLAFAHDPYLGGAAGKFTTQSYVPIFADGYPTIHRAIDPLWYSGHTLGTGQIVTLSLAFLIVVSLLKMIATSFTLSFGGAGGVFAPALFIGATGGGAIGILLKHLQPSISPSSYALVGMGAVLAAAIQAPLMSIILLFELTRNYQVMLPAMLAVVVATAIQQIFVGESLYTLPLRQEGIKVGSPVGMSALRRVTVDQLPLIPAATAEPNLPVSDVLRRMNASLSPTDFVVLDAKGRYLGMLTLDDLKLVMSEQESVALLLVGEMVRSNITALGLLDTLETAFEQFARHDVAYLPVWEPKAGGPGELKGLISRTELLHLYHVELTR